MKKIELEIIAITQSIAQSNSYAVVLGEVNGTRRLPIVIGGFEAQAIAVAIEKMSPSRPLTHDLMKNFMVAFNIELHEIIINDLQEGVFFSKLVCSSERDTIEIDSRTSDAIAMAVRFGCPIYTFENILNSTSEMMDDKEEKAEKKKRKAKSTESNTLSAPDKENLKQLTLKELNDLLNEVLNEEDYVRAIAIRDEINSRTNPEA
jgi:bifunctional DNase/RNase